MYRPTDMERRKAMTWAHILACALLMVACGSDGDDNQEQGRSRENVIVVDGVRKPVVDMTSVPVDVSGPGTAKQFSVSLNLDREDYKKEWVSVWIEDGQIGHRIDISDAGRNETFSIGYTDRTEDISLYWSDRRANGIEEGSYLQVQRAGAGYEVDFMVKYVRGRNTHTIEGYYKGALK